MKKKLVTTQRNGQLTEPKIDDVALLRKLEFHKKGKVQIKPFLYMYGQQK